jgi:hypothetical protein
VIWSGSRSTPDIRNVATERCTCAMEVRVSGFLEVYASKALIDIVDVEGVSIPLKDPPIQSSMIRCSSWAGSLMAARKRSAERGSNALAISRPQKPPARCGYGRANDSPPDRTLVHHSFPGTERGQGSNSPLIDPRTNARMSDCFTRHSRPQAPRAADTDRRNHTRVARFRGILIPMSAPTILRTRRIRTLRMT